MNLERRPITRNAARRFIAEHHGHAGPPHAWLFGTALWTPAGDLVAVGCAARPPRGLQDGTTVEVTRVCIAAHRGDHHAASHLYGALCRAATALGYRRAVTYTLADEDATSVRAAGFTLDAELDRHGDSWHTPARPRVEVDLFGERRYPSAGRRWTRALGAAYLPPR
jgi:hypothetical protein